MPLVSRLVVFLYTFLRKRGKLMKAMLSQPMAGKTDEEIIQTRERAIRILKEKGYEIVNTLFTDEWYDQENMKTVELSRFRWFFLQSHWKI